MGIDRWEDLAGKKEVDISDGEKIGSELMEENEKKIFLKQKGYISLTIRLAFKKTMFLFIIKVLCRTLKSTGRKYT